MKWLKRNLSLAGAAIVIITLFGLSIGFLLKTIGRHRQINEDLVQATRSLERLAFRDPSANAENIRAAREETKRVGRFLGSIEEHFAPADYPSHLNNMTFRIYFDTTIAHLRAKAQRSGVSIPTNYWFSFEAEKGSVSFSANSLHPLAAQLSEINSLCGVLFDAKVNSLDWVKRVPVDGRDGQGSQDYLNTKAITNATAILMPYEVTFEGFSSELAAVLEGLARSPQCFVVTNLVVGPVEQISRDLPETPRFRLLPPAHDGPLVQKERYLDRRFPERLPARIVAPTGPTPFLSEKLLRFTLSVQSVRLNKPEGTQTASTR